MSSNITSTQKALFALSMFSNVVRSKGGDQGKEAHALVTAALARAERTIGKWRIVWGPAVFAQPILGAHAMNTMYVAQSGADSERYVIAIAGTNPYSPLDWIIEDGLVSWRVPWSYGLRRAPDASISLGTAIGLVILQRMKPAAGLPGSGQRLRRFLETIDKKGVDIAVTGHSLGGALAPAVALWLAGRLRATFSAMPTAGPTPGNEAFARYAHEMGNVRMTPFYNTLDVVPQAWQESGSPSLSAIPSIYSPAIERFPLLELLVSVAKLAANDGDYAPMPDLVGLPGTINESLILEEARGSCAFPFLNAKGRKNLCNFLHQLAYQHVKAYHEPFSFDASWMPGQVEVSTELSPLLTGVLARGSASPDDILEALANRGARELSIGDTFVTVPRRQDDPGGKEVVAFIEEELRKNDESS